MRGLQTFAHHSFHHGNILRRAIKLSDLHPYHKAPLMAGLS